MDVVITCLYCERGEEWGEGGWEKGREMDGEREREGSE